MTATTHLTVGGAPALSLVLHVPPFGPWWAEAPIDGDPELSGAVDIAVGETFTLRGTIVSGGSFADQRTVRVVAGGAGWGTLLPARAYHSDAGVPARTVAQDAAVAAGETLGAFEPAATMVGVDFVRAAGSASWALERAAGGAAWWVGYDGVTVVGARATSTPTAGAYQLLAFDPVNGLAVLAVDDLASIVVGSQLAAEERMPVAQTVRELRIEVTPEAATVIAWCGSLDNDRGRLGRALEAVVRRVIGERIYGSIRYRVMAIRGDRVELQSIAPGYPDIGPVPYAPGVAGAHSTLQVGAEVLVEFIEGDRTLPRVTHFAGKDGVGWTPVDTVLDAQTLIKLGQNATEFVALAASTKARLDTLQVAHDTHNHPTAPNGPVSPPNVLAGTLGPIAATKVKAE